ncbi:hypothetical protein [Priestia koreensis]|uniref:hypothetical protein n=1 Tax=Priestia koreensis TaxID=284581 RepID=UPI001F5A94C9|nr:hypothetical protein [Priestia koreensis]UNL87564.1 hypothetical protein IE339_23975 [Priestia koreensis]
MNYERIMSKGFSDKGRCNVIKWEVQSVDDGQELKIIFLGKNSLYRQGIWLKTDKGIEVMGRNFSSIDLWEDSAPKELVLKCFTSNGVISFYNIWDKGEGKKSQSYSSGMMIKQQGNKVIYNCNDIGFETNFDKLIFSIEKL